MKGEGGSRIVGLFDCFINGYVPRREEESKAGKMGGEEGYRSSAEYLDKYGRE